MRLDRLAGMFLVFVGSAIAQIDDSPLQAVEYPDLASRTRIQGDVRLLWTTDGPILISGNPMLATTAIAVVGQFWKPPEQDNRKPITVHFVLTGSGWREKKTTVDKGHAFDRFFLRILRLKTTKTVIELECSRDERPKNKINWEDPVEVWIFGSVACKQTQASLIGGG